jgi:F-type H+-transporting ATPase subunit epsilon
MVESLNVNQRQFKFELVAPEKVEVSGSEECVILPGEDGDFMVLGGHTPLLAGLHPGVVSVLRSNNNVTRYFIAGGFADIGNAHCTVLTPHLIPVVKIVADKVAREIEHLNEELANDNLEAHERQHAEEKIKLLQIQFEAAEKYNA